MANKRIILASGSPRRKELMLQAGYEFEVISPEVDETIPEGTSPDKAVEMLSARKAAAIDAGDAVILAADTVVAFDGVILGKPADEEDAVNMLRMLSGRTHNVYTGVSIRCGDNTETVSVSSEVTFYELSEEEISAYVATGEPLDKAGAYGIQGKGGLLVKEIKGDYYNIVGLPIATVSRMINKI
ncbi:MAG: Maf family protein [Clostridia bacterium]|nr:Maf family protein [Clostridia bacterium]